MRPKPNRKRQRRPYRRSRGGGGGEGRGRYNAATASNPPRPPKIRPPLRPVLAQLFVLLGLAVLTFSTVAALQKQEPFSTWFFLFAWWSYILIVDGWVFRRKKESLLLNHPMRFAGLALWSVALWFIFEAFNLRLDNWAYQELPGPAWLRWPGYFLAFATVVPGVMETADLLETAGLIKRDRNRLFIQTANVGPGLMALGAVMMILPLLWPRLFFPLVWVGFIFLVDPINERLGAPSLLADWRRGNMSRFYILVVAGLMCGILWESWNSISLAQWTYTIPWAEGWKVFEMPILGYLGFLPFALEVFVLTSFMVAVWNRSPKPLRALLIVGALGYSLLMCRLVDQRTVASFQI